MPLLARAIEMLHDIALYKFIANLDTDILSKCVSLK